MQENLRYFLNYDSTFFHFHVYPPMKMKMREKMSIRGISHQIQPLALFHTGFCYFDRVLLLFQPGFCSAAKVLFMPNKIAHFVWAA